MAINCHPEIGRLPKMRTLLPINWKNQVQNLLAMNQSIGAIAMTHLTDQKNFFNKAALSFNNKKYDDAISYCKILIKNKKSPQIFHLAGLSYLAKGELNDAIIFLNKAIEFDSKNSTYYVDLGEALKQDKNYKLAMEKFESAIKLDAANHRAYFAAATTFSLMKIFPSAFRMAVSALSLNSNNFKYKHFIAKCLIDLQKFNEALVIFNELSRENTCSSELLLDKAELLRMMFKYQDALETAELVYKSDKNNINYYLVKSVILREMDKPLEAIKILDEGLLVKPDSQLGNFNKGVMLLGLGDFTNGWNLYEWRLKSKELSSKLNFTTKPLWNKEKNSRLLIWQEQGIGDEVMFASIFNDVKKDVEKLIVKIDYRLMPIFKRSFQGIDFIASNEIIDESEYTHHLPIGSLPKFYRNSKLSFDNKNLAYLLTNQKLNEEISIYFPRNNQRNIGISWVSTNPSSGLKRSTAIEDLIHYIGDLGANYINLQYGNVEDEINAARDKLGVNIINIKEIDNKNNIDGLFSIIENCDEVISIDNSTIHFSGSIGKKTEVLLHKTADYRWELNSSKSNWYQSIKLTRNIII